MSPIRSLQQPPSAHSPLRALKSALTCAVGVLGVTVLLASCAGTPSQPATSAAPATAPPPPAGIGRPRGEVIPSAPTPSSAAAAAGAAAAAAADAAQRSSRANAAAAQVMPAQFLGNERPPIVFVHGNGDTAALWQTTLWRFESNGWPKDRLFALDFPNPQSRDDDTQPQAGRSSSNEQASYLQAQIERIRQQTGAPSVVLVGNSRGGITIRNYIQSQADAGRPAPVSHAVLGGTPNHGVWATAGFRPNNEFNGAGPLLRRLNAPKGPQANEVTPGLHWLTLRSNGLDKFAQADGAWIGAPGTATNVNADGPALKGATNVLLPGADHRETSFSEPAFATTWRFLTGLQPTRTDIVQANAIVLDGKVNAMMRSGAGFAQTNLPLVGASVEVYATNPATGERLGGPVHRKTVGADGLWGPFSANSTSTYEFVLSPPLGDIPYSIVHTYRAPFARSSNVAHLRADMIAPADKDTGSVITFTRPRGYFGVGRDTMSFDNQPLQGIKPGVPGLASAKIKISPGSVVRSIPADFNGERIVARSWPANQNRMVVLELHN